MFNPKDVHKIVSPALDNFTSNIITISNDSFKELHINMVGRIETYLLNNRIYRILDTPNNITPYHFYVSPSRARINTGPEN